MFYKSFRFNVVLRVVAIALMVSLFVYGLSQTEWRVTNLLIGVGVLLLIANLIYYVERTDRDISNLLLAIKHEDF